MKRRVLTVMLVVLMMALLLVGCGTKTKCFWCGEEKFCHEEEILGDTTYICQDCMKEIEDMREEFG